nr:IS30 family transposase [Lentzea aerocolonigenes]
MLVAQAARFAGVSFMAGSTWFAQAGGVISNAPQPVSDRYLSLQEREEIAVLRAEKLSMREIGRRLGRSASTVSRELERNSLPLRKDRPKMPRKYRATVAQAKAEQRAKRPKQVKLAGDDRLREVVQDGLTRRRSPRQISARLRLDFPDEPEMRVSHETIYQSLYVQGRGALRRELTACLRTGRALRRPRRQAQARRARAPQRIPDMVNISERPAEAEDRAVPGHWEGDMIIGKNQKSQIGTLVERTTRFCLLLHLPGRDAATVRDAMIEATASLPDKLRQSLTWDQGQEMARHKEITVATDLDIYFCDPHSPWQRGTNENTNGLLRQYFPKATDLSVHSREHLDFVAAELNDRPRETLRWKTPAEALHELLFPPAGVATTT